jgi:hypothetical protein
MMYRHGSWVPSPDHQDAIGLSVHTAFFVFNKLFPVQVFEVKLSFVGVA